MARNKKDHVYMVYDKDGFPEFQADTLKGIAEYFKTSVASISSIISRKERIFGRTVERVDLDED